ncbi:MAG: iduronate-2-sulfatase, partial [Planctomycetes bacterium]|nr:iduronate-2-sulfatase [Planctomycetota bacterium]
QVLRPADGRLARAVMGCSIRTERWRYTEWAAGREGIELYAHSAARLEFHNLVIKPAAAARAVMEALRPLLRSRASGSTPKTPFNPKRL